MEMIVDFKRFFLWIFALFHCNEDFMLLTQLILMLKWRLRKAKFFSEQIRVLSAFITLFLKLIVDVYNLCCNEDFALLTQLILMSK